MTSSSVAIFSISTTGAISSMNLSQISSGVPSSAISPSSSKITLSARYFCTSGRWETTITVIFNSSLIFLTASKISCFVLGHAIVAGSSRSKALGCFAETSSRSSSASSPNSLSATSKLVSPSSKYLLAYNFLNTFSRTVSGHSPNDLWRWIAVSFFRLL